MLRNQIANIITMLRIVFTVPMLLMIEKYFKNGILNVKWFMACFLFCVISDFVDGKVARRLSIASSFGANLDMIADSLYVFLLHIQLFLHGRIHVLFLLLIIEKTANYFLTSHVIQKNRKEKFTYIRDPIGRIVSALYYVTPVIAVLLPQIHPAGRQLADAILLVIAIAGIMSSVYRWKEAVKK